MSHYISHRTARMLYPLLLIMLLGAMMIGGRPVAATPTPTPEGGLRIHGTVRLAHSNGPGLAGVQIFRGYAGPGPVAAITDANGAYQSKVDHLLNREHVIIYAELKGYTLDPQQIEWEQEANYVTDQEINFVARPLATTCSTQPPIPARLLVSVNQYDAYGDTDYLYVYVGLTGRTNIDGIITIEGQKASVTQKAHLEIYSGVNIEVPLELDKANFFTVYGQFDYAPGCSYITSTQFDTRGNPLIVIQHEPPPTSATTSPTP